MSLKSIPGEFNATDFVKTIQTFFYNTISLTTAILIAVVALPTDQIPPWMAWVVPLSGLINAIAFAIIRWRKDNRNY